MLVRYSGGTAVWLRKKPADNRAGRAERKSSARDPEWRISRQDDGGALATSLVVEAAASF